MKAQEENTKSQPTTSTKASAQTVEIAEISKTLSQNHTFSVYIGRQTDWGGVSHGPVTRGQREAASYFSYAVHAIDATTHPTTRRIIYETFFRCTVFLLFVFSLISWPVPKASADEVPILSEMTYPDQIAFLARSGVEIPGGEENYEYWKLFIQECISIVENDPSYMFRYN